MENGRGIYARLIQRGWFIRLWDSTRGDRGEFYFVNAQELAKYVHTWGDGNTALAPVTSGSLSEGEPVRKLEPNSKSELYQVFFGVDRVGTLIYVRIPDANYRQGIDQIPKESSANRLVGEVDGEVSPFDAPAVETEFFTRNESIVPFPSLDCYNDTRFSHTPRLRFWVNKLLLGPVTDEARDKLRRQLIPFTPVRLDPFPAQGGAPPGGGG